MITVQLANRILSVEENTLLSNLLNHHGYTDAYFAVAINRQFIPRSLYMTTILQPHDVIDIITPMQGG